MTTQTSQTTEGQGKSPQHTHLAGTRTHDHYHVSHHHKGGVAGITGDFEHRTYWHTHEHNHGELTHSHDYSQDNEETEHAKEAHVHDHTAPVQPSA
jgi:hypothetical protein